jgi:hypothetical protein
MIRLLAGGRDVRCDYRASAGHSRPGPPDLKAQSAKLDSLQRQIEIQHDALMKTLDAFRAEMRSVFAALRASNQVEVFRQMTPISERVAVVEARTK